MANRERGELALVAGGRTYTLQLTTNSCCEVEDFTNGRTSDDLIAGINQGSFKDARLLLWVALRTHHPDLATDDPDCLEAIGELIDAAGGRNAILKVLQRLVHLNTEGMGPGGASRPRVARTVPTGGNSRLTH